MRSYRSSREILCGGAGRVVHPFPRVGIFSFRRMNLLCTFHGSIIQTQLLRAEDVLDVLLDSAFARIAALSFAINVANFRRD